MSWTAYGFCEPILHKIEDTADTYLLDRQRYWWPDCDPHAVCVALPDGVQLDRMARWCPTCFPDEQSIAEAVEEEDDE